MLYISLPLLILVGLLIILVNLFTLATIFSSRSLTKPANYPIILFLITATVQGFVVVPMYSLKHLKYDAKFPWICDVFRFPYFVCGHLLTLSLVLVCIDRIIATKYPLRYRKIITRAKMLFTMVVVTIVVIAVDLMPFGNKVPTETNLGDKCAYIPWVEWSVSVITGTIIIPLIFLTISYFYIWLIALRLSKGQPKPSTVGRRKVSITKAFSQNISKILELRATKTSALLIGVFIVCWTPIAVYYLVENICNSCILDYFSESQRPRVGFAVKVISFTSSILSPLAYCWRTREFQREFRKNLNKRRWKAARIALSFVQHGGKNPCKQNLSNVDNYRENISMVAVEETSEDRVTNFNMTMLSTDVLLGKSTAGRFPMEEIPMERLSVAHSSLCHTGSSRLSADDSFVDKLHLDQSSASHSSLNQSHASHLSLSQSFAGRFPDGSPIDRLLVDKPVSLWSIDQFQGQEQTNQTEEDRLSTSQAPTNQLQLSEDQLDIHRLVINPLSVDRLSPNQSDQLQKDGFIKEQCPTSRLSVDCQEPLLSNQESRDYLSMTSLLADPSIDNLSQTRLDTSVNGLHIVNIHTNRLSTDCVDQLYPSKSYRNELPNHLLSESSKDNLSRDLSDTNRCSVDEPRNDRIHANQLSGEQVLNSNHSFCDDLPNQLLMDMDHLSQNVPDTNQSPIDGLHLRRIRSKQSSFDSGQLNKNNLSQNQLSMDQLSLDHFSMDHLSLDHLSQDQLHVKQSSIDESTVAPSHVSTGQLDDHLPPVSRLSLDQLHFNRLSENRLDTDQMFLGQLPVKYLSLEELPAKHLPMDSRSLDHRKPFHRLSFDQCLLAKRKIQSEYSDANTGPVCKVPWKMASNGSKTTSIELMNHDVKRESENLLL